jgi:hypothetical protein
MVMIENLDSVHISAVTETAEKKQQDSYCRNNMERLALTDDSKLERQGQGDQKKRFRTWPSTKAQRNEAG